MRCLALALVAWAALSAARAAPRAAPPPRAAVEGEVEGEGYETVVVDVVGAGPVRGFTRPTNRSVRSVHSFLGLRFVEKPPRFEASGERALIRWCAACVQPPSKFARWDDEHDGRIRARACPQGKFYPDELERREAELGGAASWDWARAAPAPYNDDVPDEEKEDCLTLDVYTPDDAILNGTQGQSGLLPVLLFFHGGAFVRGSSWNVKPDFILDHEGADGRFVLVAAQYRLGPLGFLAGGGNTTAGRGNAGLHDQYWALNWTRTFVHNFGGDRNNIVIGGVSAGGATSGLLYHAGCEAAAKLAAAAEAAEAAGEGSREDTVLAENDLVDCLTAAPVEDLLDAVWYWADGMLPRMPVDILTDREDKSFTPKPIMVGITREEGLYLYENKLLNDKRHLSEEIGEVILNFAGVEDELRVLGYNVQELYFHDGQLGNISLMGDGIIDFTGAAFFKAPARYMAQLNADRGADAWLYTFDYVAEQERALARAANRKPRANHGSDQIY
ncbi:Venom carboxylesterase-6, partial [Gryllus bimaculatus]